MRQKHRYTITFLICTAIAYGQTSMTLNDAIEHGLMYNPEMKAQKQTLKASQAKFWTAISPESPRVFAEVEEIPSGGDWLNDYGERKTGFSQEFDFPLNYWFYGRKAKFDKNQNQSQLDWKHLKLKSNIKTQFVRVLSIRLKQENLSNIQRITESMFQKARFRVLAGETASYDSLKLSVDKQSVQNQVSRIKRDYFFAVQKLEYLIGWNTTEKFTLRGTLQYHPVGIDSNLISTMSHPLVRQAYFHEQNARTERTLAWLDLFPKIEIRVFKTDIPHANPRDYHGGEIGLTVPVWSLLKGQGKIREAHHLAKSSYWHRILKERTQQLQIAEARTAFETAKEQVETLQQSIIREAEELVRIASRSYDVGEMGYLELVDALRTLSQVRTEYVDTLFDYYSALFNLEAATGKTLINTKLFENEIDEKH